MAIRPLNSGRKPNCLQCVYSPCLLFLDTDPRNVGSDFWGQMDPQQTTNGGMEQTTGRHFRAFVSGTNNSRDNRAVDTS